VLVKYCSWAG